jgi:hypothetical protein
MHAPPQTENTKKMSLLVGLSPEDIDVFSTTRSPIHPRNPLRPVRMWNVNHIPEDVKIGREHAIAVLGSVMNSESNIVSTIALIKRDKKQLNAWCGPRLKSIYIKLACVNGLLIDGRHPANWNDVKEGMLQSMKKNGTANIHAFEVHYGWWRRVMRWKQILEEEYMDEFYISYYPTSLGEEATGSTTTIHKLIRRKFNDLNKELQRYVAAKNGGEYLTSRKLGTTGKYVSSISFTDSVKGTYVAQKLPQQLPLTATFDCNGLCKYVRNLREMMSVLQQQNDDLKRDHLTEITVSIFVLCKLVHVMFYLHLFFLNLQDLELDHLRELKVNLQLPNYI